MRKNFLICLILCFAVVISCIIIPGERFSDLTVNSFAASLDEPVVADENDFTYRLLPANTPTKISITGYNGTATKIIIPETIKGLPVENITVSAFSGNEDISYIKLPSTLKNLSGKVFSGCSSLEKIDVAESNNYFASVDGVLYGRDTSGKITWLVAYPCGKSGSFTIPKGIETIGAYAFEHCFNLTSVNMYNTVTSIGSYAFAYCWNLESIRLSDNLRTIGEYALSYCDSLKQLTLPATLTDIGKDAFLGGIDSNGNKFYYFINGVVCAANTYAYDYLVDQALPLSIITAYYRTVTDVDTGITLIDVNNILPEYTNFDLEISTVDTDSISDTFPVRYNEAYAYDISIVSEGNEYTPNGNFILSFNGLAEGTIPSATKIYKQYGSSLVCVNGTPSTPFIGTQINSGGRFVILSNNDFSLTGDIDGDGIITLYDARAALHAATDTMTLTDEQFATADIDSDGKVTSVDARTILRYAAGIIT